MVEPGVVPAPNFEGRPLTREEYYALTPERLELLDGFLCGGPEDHKDRLSLLRALVINEGLLALVRLASPDMWREALRRAYGLEA
ncbi:MAG: hypothetical protein ACREJU_19730 [Nitrospiraceae bacterium]